MATDITQHVPMAEAAVSARTSRIELPEGSGGWQVNLAAGAVALDARSCELFGWHEDERHMSIDEYVSCVHPDERAMVRAALDDVRRDASRQFNVEFRVPSGTGDWRWLSVRASASAGSGADSSTLVGLHVDVTPARLFALDLEQARLAANVAVRNMRGLLARMSHEIRTPMNGVLGYLELLGATQLTAAQHEYVDVATSSADGLLKVVDEVLDYSRGEDGRLEAEMLRFNPARLVGDVLALMTPVATGQGVTLAAPAGEGFGDDVIGDAFKVRQVLLNLVGNAIKFTPGGRVTVAGKRVEHPSGMPRLHFEVADTGAGLAGVDIALLFEPYAQAEVSTARRFGGTGLGLAICRQLVDVLDGSIEAGTNDNGGATFRFEVPVLVPALSATEDIDRAPMVDADAAELSGRLHVLVVDDDATSRALLCTMLTRLGCRVDTATDGAEALALWSQVRHDLVLLDRYMPGMDGLAATRALRAAEAALPGPPHRSRVVAVTASSTDEDRQSCVAAGMDDVFAKPVRHQALVRLLLREQRLRERGHGAPPEAS